MICPQCEAPVQGNNLFCALCGAEQDAARDRPADKEEALMSEGSQSKVPTVAMHVPRTGQVWILHCSSGPHQDERFHLDDLCHVGRGEDNDIVLADSRTSRRHVRFSNRAGMIYVTDLGSTNGTLVNGKEIYEDTRLKEWDQVTLGETTLILESEVVTTRHPTVGMRLEEVTGENESGGGTEDTDGGLQAKFCGQCGHRLRAATKFCGQCGEKI